MLIHPTAIVDKSVKLDNNVSIGAYSVISGDVEIGAGTIIKDHATLYGPLRMGTENVIHPGAVVGNVSQDLKYKGEESIVIIGNNNSIRECVTIHQGTEANQGRTIIGSNNLLMAYTHIAHDCTLGNNIIIANGTQLAGHININDFAYIGGLVGVHQFVTIGSYCFVGFLSRVNKDVPPFTTVEGNPSRERCINVEGLKRKGFSQEEIVLLKKAFMILFGKEKTLAGKEKVLTSAEYAGSDKVKMLLEFVIESSRGKNGRALEAYRK